MQIQSLCARSRSPKMPCIRLLVACLYEIGMDGVWLFCECCIADSNRPIRLASIYEVPDFSYEPRELTSFISMRGTPLARVKK